MAYHAGRSITSYSKATPSGSFSANQVSAASAFAKTLEVFWVSDLLARIHIDEHGHCWILSDAAMRSGPSLWDGYALGPLTSEGLSPGSFE